MVKLVATLLDRLKLTNAAGAVINPATDDTLTNGSLRVGGNVTIVPPPTVFSAANSSSTPLAGNATFTGTAVDVSAYAEVRVLVYSDKASAASGWIVEFSQDGANWDDSSTDTFTPGPAGPNQGQGFAVPVRGQFARVVYTNGSQAQTTFRLETYLAPQAVYGDVVGLAHAPDTSNHAMLTMSQLIGQTTGGGGGLVPVKVNPSGTLTADVSGSTGVGVTGIAADTFSPRYVDAVKSFAQQITTSTDITPTAGKRIRVLWVAFVPSPDNTTANLVTVSYPTTGKTLYVGYAMAHWQRFDDGATNEAVHIGLANTQPVAVTVHYEEL